MSGGPAFYGFSGDGGRWRFDIIGITQPLVTLSCVGVCRAGSRPQHQVYYAAETVRHPTWQTIAGLQCPPPSFSPSCSSPIACRLELFQHALRGVDMWEGSGVWPGTLPASPLPPTRLSSHRRLSRSLSTTHPLPPQETDHMGHRRAATLSSPPRASGFVGPEETAGEEEEDTWQCAQSMPLPPLSSEGLERMNLATVKKGNYCIVADTEVGSRPCVIGGSKAWAGRAVEPCQDKRPHHLS